MLLIDDRPEAATDGLAISVDSDGADLTVLTVYGDLIRRHRPFVQRTVLAALASSTVVIDLGGVRLLDAPTLAAITRPAADARRRGRRVTILPPATADHERVEP